MDLNLIHEDGSFDLSQVLTALSVPLGSLYLSISRWSTNINYTWCLLWYLWHCVTAQLAIIQILLNVIRQYPHCDHLVFHARTNGEATFEETTAKGINRSRFLQRCLWQQRNASQVFHLSGILLERADHLIESVVIDVKDLIPTIDVSHLSAD